MRTIILFSFLAFITGLGNLSAQNFYLHPNGVTCMCPAAAIGETGVVNGVTYTKRTREQITTINSSTTCTSGISNMSNLFWTNYSFNEDITTWDVSSVTTMENMFGETNFNQEIGVWDVSNVTNMKDVFQNAEHFNKDISNWDVSNVTNMSNMFGAAFLFNQDISNWNVSGVTNMEFMFAHTVSFNVDITTWDVSNVVNMNSMFLDSQSFNQNIGVWDVSNVVSMQYMFMESTFNQDISNWNVSSVVNMSSMFSDNTLFNQDLGTWQFNPNVMLTDFLRYSGLDVNNYDSLLISFSNQGLINKELGADDLVYCNLSARNDLINNKGWVIHNDSYSQPNIISPIDLNIEPSSGSCVATGVDLGTPTITGCGVGSITNNAPSEFPIGVTQVLWTLIDGNGVETTDSQTVTVTLPVDIAEICYITSDEVEVTKNRIFLYNVDGLNVDNYEVRRETSTGGVYETVGFIVPPENSFLDNSSNNNSQTYRYLINTTDVCGATSPDSDYHKTILLQSGIATDNSVNLSWNPYIGFPYSTYNIYRKVNGGNYELLISLPSTSTTYNDTEADVLSNDYGYYVSIDVANCTGIPFSPIALKSNRQIIGNLNINDWEELERQISLVPNPAITIVTVYIPDNVLLKEVRILNNLGQLISKYDTSTIDTEYLNAGVYYLQIVTDKGTFNKSLIKE